MSTSKRLIERLERHAKLAPFQRRFIRGAFRPGVLKAVLSCPRGAGKSTLSGWLLAEAIDPAGALFVPGSESVLVAGSRDQAGAVFRFLRQALGEDDYRYQDSGQRVGATHRDTNTRVRVASSDARRAFGIVGARLIIGDEPGAWQARGGAEMYDALETSGGKNEQTFVLIGTRAPGSAGGWWRELVDHEDDPQTYVQVHDAPVDDDGDVPAWDSWRTIRRANPLIGFNPYLRPKLEEELRKARKSGDAKRRFITYRLNRPQQPASEVLVTVDQWRQVEGRSVPHAEGRPVVGVDTGSTRSWSTAAILWRNGRLDAVAAMPGLPTVERFEALDAKPAGTYQRLVDAGVVTVDAGRRVVAVRTLIDRVLAFRPVAIVCDRFRIDAVRDAVAGRCPVLPRVTRWSEATEDIQATRRLALDGDLAVVPGVRPLYRLTLAESEVQEDDDQSVRLVKRTQSHRHRDDLAKALTLAAGLMARLPAPRPVEVLVANPA